MGGYLEQYGGELKREKAVRVLFLWGGLALILAAVIWFILHFVIPNRAEKNRAEEFFKLLAAEKYQQAYALWGCTEASPCRDFPFTKFMEDWGKEQTPVKKVEVLDGESCGSGVIVDVDTGQAETKKVWVERGDETITSMPPGVTNRCPQGNRIYDFFRNMRYKMHGRTFQ